MNKRERVDAALRGEAVDRVPISFWGHDYIREWSAEGLAEAMLANYRAYDWDYMKVNPRASYHVEDWGATLQHTTDPNHGHTFTSWPVHDADDWRNLRPLEPDQGVLGEQLAALRLIRDGLGGEAYFIQTIFSPLSVAKYLVGNHPEPVKHSIADDPEALKAALDVITQTFATYSRPAWRRARAASSSPRPAGQRTTYSPRMSIASSASSTTCACWRRWRARRRSTCCTTAATASTSTCWPTIR